MSTVLGPTRPQPDDAAPGAPERRSALRLRGDLVAVVLVMALVATASFYGFAEIRRGVRILVDWPPVLAEWMPHATQPAFAVSVVLGLLVALAGPAVAARLPWWPLLGVTYAVSAAWTLSLALIDGYQQGIVERLTTPTEYLFEVQRFPGLGPFLETFAGRIVGTAPGTLVTHASGHPPLATLFYVAVNRLFGDGGGPAGLATIFVGASASLAVAVTIATLGGLRWGRGGADLPRSADTVTAGRELARRYIPFGVLFPGAVWVGVSADGVFAAVFAWAVAFFAMGAVRRGVGGYLLSFVGGVGFGAALFMSYGLAAAGLAPIVVALLTRRWTPLIAATAGLAVVVGLFHLGGFWWYEGYEQVKLRYYQPGEFGLLRPYRYWVWANFAAFALALGPAVVAGLRRCAFRPRSAPAAVLGLVAAVAVAVAVADLSGLSKSEVERIWLPFGTWMVLTCVLLPRASHRWWLLGQAALAITVNSLLLTTW